MGTGARPVREDVVIASKFGWDIDPDTGTRGGLNSRPEHVRRAVDGMLRRLRTDHIDAEVLPLCEELGIGFVCWAPLGMAFTTGTISPLLQDWAVPKGATSAQDVDEVRFSPADMRSV
ncbi:MULTISPECIES: hypothetical protein [Streptomyces]|uniref:NADP-dependent oxidoreductase domain-containing protein n=2 Tax=Streptomyces TaxID=1883 RepID=A0ABV9IRR1_9ACTN